MIPSRTGVLLEHFRNLVASKQDGTSDRELLQRFAHHRDEAAFTTLVHRHGPMVLQVCQRTLHRRQDAEDVCQAVFLVLASKAASRGWHESIANWLHQVAYHLALKARTAAACRMRHESQAPARPATDVQVEITGRELRAVLDEELARLPDKYRAPLVLCYLEGATRDEAARHLGWPLGTLKNRVERGRELLGRRLAARGLTLSAGLSTALLLESPSQAALPAGLAATIVQGSARFAMGRILAGTSAAEPAMRFARMMLDAMSLQQLKIAVLWLVGGCILAAGVGLAAHAVVFSQPVQPAVGGRPASDPDRPNAVAGEQERTDQSGDALPKGAVSRLGTTRLRHGVFVSWLQFTPDGQCLISQGGDGVRIWKAATGEQLRYFPSETPREQMPHEGTALSPDGRLLAYPGESGMHICEVATGRRVRTIGTGRLRSARFSPDGRILAVQRYWVGRKPADQPMRDFWPFELWDVASGQLLRSAGGAASPSAVFNCLAFSPDGKSVITAGKSSNMRPPVMDHTIRFWETSSGKLQREFSVGIPNPRKLAFSPDGTLLAVICDGDRGTENRVRIWDVAAGKEVRQLVATSNDGISRQTYYSTALAFAPDGRTLYTGGINGTLVAWDPKTGEELRRIGSRFISPRALAVSPDNKTLAADVAGEAIRLIDCETGKDRLTDLGHECHVLRTAITPDARTIVTGDQGLTLVWDAETGRQLHRFEGDRILFSSLSLIDNGHTLITTELDKTGKTVTLRARELATGKEVRSREWPASRTFPLTVAPDGKLLILGEHGVAFMVMDLETGKELHRLPWPAGASFMAGGTLMEGSRTLVLFSYDQTMYWWDLATGRKLRQYPDPAPPAPNPGMINPSGVTAVAVGDTLLAYGLGKSIVVRELTTGQEVRRIDDLPYSVSTLAFSSDQHVLAWNHHLESTIRLLEVASGKQRQELAGHLGRIQTLSFSANGKLLLSGGYDTTALVWDLTGRRGPEAVQDRPPSEKDLDALWEDLAGDDAPRAYRAIQELAAARGQAVPYLAQRLRPIPTVDGERLTKLIADLGSAQFAVRQRATKELDALGESALAAYQSALAAKPALEVQQRLEELLQKRLQERRHMRPDDLRTLRALEALEHGGTPEARRVLATLAQGAPGAWLTQEATAALARMAKLAGVASR
jgi:RNA polymerase sigma factor (sigma-70 family)